MRKCLLRTRTPHSARTRNPARMLASRRKSSQRLLSTPVLLLSRLSNACSGAHTCQPLSRSAAGAGALPITPHNGAVHEGAELGAAVGHPAELGSTYEAEQRRPPEDASELLGEVRATLGPFELQVGAAAEGEGASDGVDLEALLVQQLGSGRGGVCARTIHAAGTVHDGHCLPQPGRDARERDSLALGTPANDGEVFEVFALAAFSRAARRVHDTQAKPVHQPEGRAPLQRSVVDDVVVAIGLQRKPVHRPTHIALRIGPRIRLRHDLVEVVAPAVLFHPLHVHIKGTPPVDFGDARDCRHPWERRAPLDQLGHLAAALHRRCGGRECGRSVHAGTAQCEHHPLPHARGPAKLVSEIVVLCALAELKAIGEPPKSEQPLPSAASAPEMSSSAWTPAIEDYLPVKRGVLRQMEKGGEDVEAEDEAEDEAAAGPALVVAFAAAIDAHTRSSAPSPGATKHTS
eukprot:scaffold7332_cov63-Phaeocystis_antarctica.AAC.1